ncbi:MAG: single-stranded-DNA-specific exonuclease RecJ, partial [Bacillota bacterium]|nr:single-stranded-DNA-specific exonuclease RecJ [Bacillota bacterium]
MYFKYQQLIQDDEEVNKIKNEYNLRELTSRLLLNKNLKSLDEIEDYLNPEYTKKSNPKNIKNIIGATELFKANIDNNNKITIYGDYDADGVTSTAQLLRFLRGKNSNVKYSIPHREQDGYGLNLDKINEITDDGTKLLITVDCGITNIEEIKHAKEKGLDVIIIDHHNCEEELPDANFIINPKIYDEEDYFANLCGAGLTYKFIENTVETFYPEDNLNEYIQLAAVGTVADIVSLKGENRRIVKKGLKSINTVPIEGIKAIKNIVNKNIIDSGDISFRIAPMINSSGRMDHADNAVELLYTKNISKGKTIAEKLFSFNEDRKVVEKEIYDQVDEYVEKHCQEDNILIVRGLDWHEGVIGIVSSKITEKYNKPSLIFTNNEDDLKASGRSIENISLYDELKSFKKCFKKFGGHSQAVGLTIEKDNFNDFKKDVVDHFNKKFNYIDLRKYITIDYLLESKHINVETFEEAKILEPYGFGNSKPKFLYSDFTVKSTRKIGKEKRHIKVTTEKNGVLIDLLYFNYKKDELQALLYYKEVVCSIDLNYFRGNVTPQLIVRDINNYIFYEEKAEYIKLLTSIENSIKTNLSTDVNINKKVDIELKDIEELNKYKENNNKPLKNYKIIYTINKWIPNKEEYDSIKLVTVNNKRKIIKTNIFKLIKYLKD